MRYIHLDQSEKSPVAEHIFETGYNIDFNNKHVLAKTAGHMECMIKEAIEIRLHPNNFSRDQVFTVNWSCYLVTNMMNNTDAPIWRQAKAKQALDSGHWPPLAVFSLNMSPSMYVGGMFWKQICHNPDDGDRAGP
jgi:hypothetical protein